MHNTATEAVSPLGSPPRKARLRRGVRNLLRTYRALIALVVVVLGGWAVFDAIRLYDLSYRTVETTGVITKKSTVPKSAGRPGARLDYRLEYSFTDDDGATIGDIASVTPEIYEATEVGEPCTVVYLPGRAEHWLFDNQAARSQPRFMLIGRGSAVLVAIVVLLFIERPLRREVRLARHGEVAPGQILATGKGRRRRARPWITYAFRTASGAILEGKCGLPRGTGATARAPGTPIEVLYDPRRPSVNKARLGLEFIEFAP